MRGGRLKDAKIVMESRSAKSAKLDLGTGRGGNTVDVRAPNIFAY